MTWIAVALLAAMYAAIWGRQIPIVLAFIHGVVVMCWWLQF